MLISSSIPTNFGDKDIVTAGKLTSEELEVGSQFLATVIPLTDTSSALASVVPLSGQYVYESDTGRMKIGDGTNPCSNLPYLRTTATGLNWEDSNCLFITPTDNVKLTYESLCSSIYDSQMGLISSTNRRVLIFLPGVYYISETIQLEEYVDIAAFKEGSVYIYDSENPSSEGEISLFYFAQKSNDESLGTVTNYITGISGRSLYFFESPSGNNLSINIIKNCNFEVYNSDGTNISGSVFKTVNTIKLYVDCEGCVFVNNGTAETYSIYCINITTSVSSVFIFRDCKFYLNSYSPTIGCKIHGCILYFYNSIFSCVSTGEDNGAMCVDSNKYIFAYGCTFKAYCTGSSAGSTGIQSYEGTSTANCHFDIYGEGDIASAITGARPTSVSGNTYLSQIFINGSDEEVLTNQIIKSALVSTNVTNSDAQIEIGGYTDISLEKGYWRISASVQLKYVGATFAASQTCTIRIHNTSADSAFSSSNIVVPLNIVTTFTGNAGFVKTRTFEAYLPTGASIGVYAQLSANPSAGNVQVTSIELIVEKVLGII